MKYHTFLPQFHPLILAGSKTTTIRGSTRVKVGERFALRYWCGRPYGKGASMGFLGTAMCIHINRIELTQHGIALCRADANPDASHPSAHPDLIAMRDGFPSWAAMRDHFGKRLPFSGVLIAWDPTTFVAGAP